MLPLREPVYSRTCLGLPLRARRIPDSPRLTVVIPNTPRRPAVNVARRTPIKGSGAPPALVPTAHARKARTQRLGALGVLFVAVRTVQFIGLVVVVGMTANFAGEIMGSEELSASLTSTLVVVGSILAISLIAALYAAVTYLLHKDASLPHSYAAVADAALAITFGTVASILGRPVTLLSCSSITASRASPAASLIVTMSSILPGAPEHPWVAAAIGDRGACFEIKIVWGLTIALAVLFTFTAAATTALGSHMRRMEAIDARLTLRDLERGC